MPGTLDGRVGIVTGAAQGIGKAIVDKLAKEGMLFTDHYSQPTCTPSRAAFITGQLPIRTGLTTVGMAGIAAGVMAATATGRWAAGGTVPRSSTPACGASSC